MVKKGFSILALSCAPMGATAGAPPMELRSCRVRACEALWFDDDFKKAAALFKAALAQNPDDYETNLDFGMACLTYCRPPDYQEAQSHILAAARVQENVFNQYLLETIAIHTGAPHDPIRIRISDLLRAGRDRDVQVRPPDLKFGGEQYQAMLKSVPAMKLYVPREGWLSTWAAGKFAGVGLRNHVEWKTGSHSLDASTVTVDDDDGFGDMALFMGPDDGDRAGKTGLRQAESYWESFVFEMLNDEHRERTTWIWMRSRAGKMGDLAYGTQNRAFEQQTDLAVNDFYFKRWKPYCEKMGLPTDQALWSPRNVYPEDAVCKVFTGYDRAYLDPKH
jgi:hypothetical protein